MAHISEKSSLTQKHCVSCRKAVPLPAEEINALYRELPRGWTIVNQHHLEKEFTFSDFRHALNFTNLVARIAEAEDHHPEIHLAWGKVVLKIWTHRLDGLTESDFILAAKSDVEFPTSRQEACF